MSKQSKLLRFASLILLAAMVVAACSVFTPSPPIIEPTQEQETGSAPDSEESLDATKASPTENTDSEVDATPNESDEGNSSETIELAGPDRNLDDTFEPFWEVWELLNLYYVDQPLDNDALAQGAIQGMWTYTDTLEISVSEDLADDFANAADTPREAEDAFLPFWQAWAASGDERGTPLMRAAISGMIDTLGDQHTSYMDPDQFIQANIPVDGTYEGIGAWVDTNVEYLTIVTPMPNSPAEGAGLRPGDQIIKIDGEDMTGIDGNLVIRRVLGPAGSEVTLTVRREGSEDFDVVIKRATIVIPSVDGYIIEDTNIAYVALFSFGDSTTEDLRETLAELMAENPDGLIFDLRNNGGGLLVTSVEVTSEFIKEGLVLSEVYGDGTRDTYDSLGDGLATDIPMVLLVNGGSASASEFVAGALKAYERAPLVGTTTFGKGTVQSWIPLSDDGAVRITIARWLAPGDLAIHEVGLEPDYVVEITDEDFENGVDPQLEKAIELLSQP